MEIIAICLAAYACVLYTDASNFGGEEWFKHTLLFIPSSALLVYIFAVNRGIISKLLTNRVYMLIKNHRKI